MLACPNCASTYPSGPSEQWRCSCGHALEFAEQPRPGGAPPAPTQLDRDRGLWAFESLLPVDCRVTLGEGWTPIVDAPGWDARFKLEYLFPSGSFKDRGATTTISRALELGVDRVIEDSSGNAGAAIAQYAARAGIDAEIYVPASAPASKRAAIEQTGAEVVAVEGSRTAVSEACQGAVAESRAWYASHAWNPAFIAGTTTFALETAAQREWTPPDVVVLPLGHGTLLLGAYRGFRTLRSAGWIEAVPTIYGVQATGFAPFVDDADRPDSEANELADGVHVREPARATQIRAALSATGGDAVAVDEAETESALGKLRRAGFAVEPTSAVAPAALEALRSRGAIAPEETVLVPLTGSGLKY